MITHQNPPVVIIGAGLAGLACAKTLQQNNIPYLIIESSADVGGRIKTTKTVDGYRLDHGFQVLLTSYPELKYFIDLKKLDLKLFKSGCLIFDGQKTQLLANPVLHPSRIFEELRSNLVSIKDKFLVVKLLMNLLLPVDKKKLQNMTTLQYLQHFGFSQKFIDLFWSPFLTGVFLDSSLSISADFFVFLMKGFSSGRVAVPALGMQEIPNQIAQSLDQKNIRLSSAVEKIYSDYVVLKDKEKILAKNVVVTYKESEIAAEHNSVQNYYFTTSEKVDWGSWLVIVPQKLKLNISTIAIMNHVSVDYGLSPTEHLLSVSVVKSETVSIEHIEQEIRQIANMPLSDLKFIQKFEIHKALPKMNQPCEMGFEVKNNIYYCGDWTISPSINGALKSGLLTAENIIKNYSN